MPARALWGSSWSTRRCTRAWSRFSRARSAAFSCAPSYAPRSRRATGPRNKWWRQNPDAQDPIGLSLSDLRLRGAEARHLPGLRPHGELRRADRGAAPRLALRPRPLIVDSIQTVFLPGLESSPGSVSQVRECAARLMLLAKGRGMAAFLVGHVTKDGAIAGPRVLEHLVDTVLYFEGEQHHAY